MLNIPQPLQIPGPQLIASVSTEIDLTWFTCLSSLPELLQIDFIVRICRKVGILRVWPEVEASEDVEGEGGGLARGIAHPDVLERHGGPQQVHHNAGEVDVGHHQHVELAEQGELVQRPRRLAVRLAGLTQMLDGPDDGEQDGAAADDVHQVQDVHPGEPAVGGGGVLVQHDDGHLRHHLQRDDYHQDFLLPVCQEHLEVGPAGADEHHHGEKKNATNEGEEVEEVRPPLRMPRCPNQVVHTRLTEQSQRLEHDEHDHELVDAVCVGRGLDHHHRPQHRRHHEQNEHHHVDGRKLVLADRKVVPLAV
mmetsp:Transcript_5872/g.16759  ORF Transcript_5872/g.16759 Transcript_5872/m.16759 type:complete len:307 (-) Transcript_5872:617-1537(-)